MPGNTKPEARHFNNIKRVDEPTTRFNIGMVEENASSPLPPTFHYDFPCYVGGLEKSLDLRKELIFKLTTVFYLQHEKHKYVFDFVEENNIKCYEDRLKDCRFFINQNREHFKELIMRRVETLSELTQIMKQYAQNGYLGAVYFYANDKPETRDFSNSFRKVIFKRKTQ